MNPAVQCSDSSTSLLFHLTGSLQYEDVDLAAEGGYLTALQKEFTVMPTGPTLVVELKPKVQHPILNGIEIYAREVDAEGTLAPTLLAHFGSRDLR